MKHSSYILAAGALAMALTLPAAGTARAGDMPRTLDINTQANHPGIKGLPKDKKAVKGFSHAAHARKYLAGNAAYSANPFEDDFVCAACHPGKGSVEALSAADPDTRLAEALRKAGGPKKLKNYFHGICRSCHQAMKKAGKATGPTGCKGCHSRK